MDFDCVVLSGGGLCGFGQLGFLNELQERGKLSNIKKFFGTSVGALISALVIVGIPINKIFEKLLSVNDSIIKVGNLTHLLTRYGLDDAEFFMATIVDLFIECGKSPLITFKDLSNLGKQLYVSVVNLSKNRVEYFSHITVPNMKILDSVRASISIPILFDAIKFNGDYYIDGGLIDNYPMEFAQKICISPIGCFTETEDIVKVTSFETFMYKLAVCTLCKPRVAEPSTVVLSTKVSGMNFNASSLVRQELFLQGQMATCSYLDNMKRTASKARRKSI